jgi:hypothetical protein
MIDQSDYIYYTKYSLPGVTLCCAFYQPQQANCAKMLRPKTILLNQTGMF